MHEKATNANFAEARQMGPRKSSHPYVSGKHQEVGRKSDPLISLVNSKLGN